MSRQIVSTDRAPKAIGTYSQAVRVGDTVYLSGQIPLVPETMELAAGRHGGPDPAGLRQPAGRGRGGRRGPRRSGQAQCLSDRSGPLSAGQSGHGRVFPGALSRPVPRSAWRPCPGAAVEMDGVMVLGGWVLRRETLAKLMSLACIPEGMPYHPGLSIQMRDPGSLCAPLCCRLPCCSCCSPLAAAPILPGIRRPADRPEGSPTAPQAAGAISPAIRPSGVSSATWSRSTGSIRTASTLVLAKAQKENWIIEEMDKPVRKSASGGGPTGAWTRYRAKFVTPDNIEKGVAFWQQYADVLQRASAKYGVPPEIIVGIIGVETRWGRIMGKTRIIDALATLSFAYPRRSDYFTGELEHFLVMARDEGFDPFAAQGFLRRGHGSTVSSCRRASTTTRWISAATDTATCGTRWMRSAVWPTISRATAGAPVSRWRCGRPRPAPGPVPLKAGFDTSYTLSTLAARGSRRPGPPAGRAGQPAQARCGQRLRVLAGAAQLLCHHPLQPQHLLRDGGLSARQRGAGADGRAGRDPGLAGCGPSQRMRRS